MNENKLRPAIEYQRRDKYLPCYDPLGRYREPVRVPWLAAVLIVLGACAVIKAVA